MYVHRIPINYKEFSTGNIQSPVYLNHSPGKRVFIYNNMSIIFWIIKQYYAHRI